MVTAFLIAVAILFAGIAIVAMNPKWVTARRRARRRRLHAASRIVVRTPPR